MKKLFVFILLLNLTLACSDDPASKVKKENLEKAKEQLAKMDKFPVMQFDYTEVDFGQRKEGEVLDTVFTFTNTGEAPLIISKVKSSCGCTVPEWPQKPIQPGEKGRIVVRFDTKNRKGNQVKTVTIHSNEKQLTRTLRIKAQVEGGNKTQSQTSKLSKKIKLPKINPLGEERP